LDPHSPAGDFGLCYHWLTGPLDHGPDPIGVVMFHTVEIRPGWVPSVLRGLVPSMRFVRERILATGWILSVALAHLITVFVSHPPVTLRNETLCEGWLSLTRPVFP